MLRPRGHEASHLSGIEQTVGIDIMLETELIGIDALVTAAVLDGKDVRVGDIDAALLMHPHNFIQSIRIRIMYHRQSAAGDATVEADEFEMLQYLVRKQLPHLGD